MTSPQSWLSLADRFSACGIVHAEWRADNQPQWKLFDAPQFAAQNKWFKLYGRQAAGMGGAKDGPDAWMVWLDRVARESHDFLAPLKSPRDVVQFVDALSASFCRQLEAEALITERSAPAPCPLIQQTSTPAERSSWLRATMNAKGCTKYRLAVDSRVDRQTIQKILDGKPVHSLVLAKLARQLSEPSSSAR